MKTKIYLFVQILVFSGILSSNLFYIIMDSADSTWFAITWYDLGLVISQFFVIFTSTMYFLDLTSNKNPFKED